MPDQYRADFMSDRDDWSILERRRQKRLRRIAACQEWARAVKRKIVGNVHSVEEDGPVRIAGRRRVLPGEQKRRKLQWLDASNGFDVSSSDSQRSLRQRKLRHRRRHEWQRRYRNHLMNSISESSFEEERSIEARAKAIGLVEPAYHRRWYRAPRHGVFSPHSLSIRALHQYASLASPVLASPLVSVTNAGYRGHCQSAAARRRLNAIKEMEVQFRKQERKVDQIKSKVGEQVRNWRRCHYWQDKTQTDNEMLAETEGSGNSSILISTDSTMSKNSAKPLSAVATFKSSRVSNATDTAIANAPSTTRKYVDDPSRTLTANDNNNQDSKASSVQSEATASSLAHHEGSRMVPNNQTNQLNSSRVAEAGTGGRPYVVRYLHSSSSRRSYRSNQTNRTNRTRRSAPHRAIHRALRHTHRFLRFVNNNLGKTIWRCYYRWIYPFWDVWQERKQQERALQQEKEKHVEYQQENQQANPPCRQNFFADGWSCLRSWSSQWFCTGPWSQNDELNTSSKDDYPPSKKLDALEAQCNSARIASSVYKQHQILAQLRSSHEATLHSVSFPNIDEQTSAGGELRRVDPIPISSDIDSDHSGKDQGDEPSAGSMKTSRRKTNFRSNENDKTTWTKGCILCGLERLGAAVAE